MPIMLAILLAVAEPVTPAQPALATADRADLNPNAMGLLERDPALMAWAVRRYDTNHDGWLTSFEAQPALSGFKELADTNRDGRVTVGEYAAAKAFVVARYAIAAPDGSPAP